MYRRRVKRRLADVAFVVVLSAAIGWALTRQSQSPAFSIGASSQGAPSSAPHDSSQTGAHVFGNPRTALGPYTAQEIADAALHDAARDIDIHVRLLYPRNIGRFPVVVFSPDDRESDDCCESLVRHWVSHGYAVVQLTRVAALHHMDRNAGTSLQAVVLKHAIGERRSVAVGGTGALDVTSAIDSLASLQTRFPELRGKLDAAHIGVAGRGAGAVAAEAIAGAVLDLPGRPNVNLADPRARAVLCISPQGPGKAGLSERSFEQMVLPYLGITSEDDASQSKLAPVAWHRMAFERSQPGDKYHLAIGGGEARSPVSADASSAAEPNSMHIREASLAFWDAYLKHDVAAKRYLQSDALEKASGATLTLQRR